MSDKDGRHSTHSTYSASSAHRWAPASGCAASAILATIAPRSPSSEASLEGTQAHELLERQCSAELVTPEELAQYPLKAVQGVDKVFDLFKLLGVNHTWDILPERKWTWPVVSWLPDDHLAYGFSDLVLLDHREHAAHVIDYKHGKFPVDAEGSRQLMHYAHGVLAEYGDDWQITGHIVQPYRWDDKGPFSSWEMPAARLAFFADEVKRAIDKNGGFHLLGDFGTLEYNPSASNCHWCPGFSVCPVAHGMPKAFSHNDPPELMGPDRLTYQLKLADTVEVQIAELRKHAFERARAGEKLPGFKLVNKQGRRAWLPGKTDEIAETLMAYDIPYDTVAPREIVSPSEADKLVKAALKDKPKETVSAAIKNLADLQDKPGSREVTLVSTDDRRPAVDPRTLLIEHVKLPVVALPESPQS